MSTKEEIQAQALKSFRTVEVEIGAAKVKLRELSKDERQQLEESIWKFKDGKFETEKDPDSGLQHKIARDDVDWLYAERWIAATITPAFTVEEILLWPVSLRTRVLAEAEQVNNIRTSAEIAKN